MPKQDVAFARDFLRQAAQHTVQIPMPSPTGGSIKRLSQCIKELADIMPDAGRVNYALMSIQVKEKVDIIVNEVLSNPIYAEKLSDITDAVRS